MGPDAGTLSRMSSIAPDHPLDNVLWKALDTSQAEFARGGPLARRFRPEFARFAGMPVLNDSGLRALAADLAPDEVVALVASGDSTRARGSTSSIARTWCRWSVPWTAKCARPSAFVRWVRPTCRA